jgi:hypothetical protein
MGCTMWEVYNCHPIGGRRLFALGSKHKAFLLRGIAAQRSSGCKLIGGRRVDLRCRAGPDQIRSSRLRGRCSLASIVIALGVILPVVATIGHLRIDRAGRVEILVYEQNRFIRARIRDKCKEVKNPYQRRRIIAPKGRRHATGTCSRHPIVKQMGYKPA